MMIPSRMMWTVALPVMLWLSVSPAASAERQLTGTERFPVEEGARIVVDAADLNVRIRGADVADVEVLTELRISGIGENKAEAWIADRTPEFSSSTEELRLSVRAGTSGFLGIGHLTSRARVGLVLPGSVVPDITTTSGRIEIKGDFPAADPLRMRTFDGTMEMEGAAGSLEIRTTSGDAVIKVVRALGQFSARSASANISLDGGARYAAIDTASGQVTLTNLSGSVLVETSTGKVTLTWDRLDPDHSVTVRSSSGKVHLTIPAGVRPRGTLMTTTGTVRCSLPGEGDDTSTSYQLAGDGPLIDVETASSDIELTTGGSWD